MKVTEPKDYTKFIKTWLKAKKYRKDLAWIADQLGIEHDEVRGASLYLRNRGVLLPNLKNTVTIPTEYYNQLIESHLSKI